VIALSRTIVGSSAECAPFSASSLKKAARIILGGIEIVHMMREDWARFVYNSQLSVAEQFNILAT
jgi:hypothetical protein